MNITAGTLLNNRYRITSVLGQGGMGAVYRAVDENLEIPVAVKENLFLTEEYSRQFQREANILASLRHHNLPRVRDYFTLPGVGQYLVMDFIEGEDLRQRIERTNMLPEEEVILIGAHICDALTHLHNRIPQIIHRDIKPGNIKITPEGDVVLVDFGLAKEMHEDQHTTTGARAMTPGYSPPEQYGTAHTDTRSDIYSLGATLYAALTGVIPEDGLTRATGKSRLTPIRSLRPKVNRKLAAVIEKALAVEPEDRYQNAEEMKLALIEAGDMVAQFQTTNTVAPPPADGVWSGEEGGSPPPAERISIPPAPISRPSRRLRSRRSWLAASVIGLAAMIALFIIFYQPGGAPAAGAPTPSASQVLSLAPSASPVSGVFPTETSISTGVPPAAIISTESPTQSPQPTPTPLGGGHSQIAFSSNRTGSYQIWLMSADGTMQRQLTSVRDGACQPVWSPDGEQLAFISPCVGRKDSYPGSSIYLMNADGSNVHLLPLTPSIAGDYDPSWSPDGKKLAFTSLRNGRQQVLVFDLTNSLLSVLSDTVFPDKQPAWSPFGQQLSFVREAPNGQVWVMDADGRHPFQFSPSGGINNLWPVWSRDGQTILYSQTSVDVINPWLIGRRYEDRTNARESRIPPAQDSNVGPVVKVDVSPDGMWLAFESWPQGVNHDIYIMTATGANLTRLTTDPAFDMNPAWRPRIQK